MATLIDFILICLDLKNSSFCLVHEHAQIVQRSKDIKMQYIKVAIQLRKFLLSPRYVEIVYRLNRLLREVTYVLTGRSGTCRIARVTKHAVTARWHHRCHKRSHVPFFAVCLTVFPLEFRPHFDIGPSPSNSTEQKNLSDQRL